MKKWILFGMLLTTMAASTICSSCREDDDTVQLNACDDALSKMGELVAECGDDEDLTIWMNRPIVDCGALSDGEIGKYESCYDAIKSYDCAKYNSDSATSACDFVVQ